MAARTVNVEFFFAGGCGHCTKAREALREVAQLSPRVEWQEVDVGKNPLRAVDVGVVATPAVAIDGDLVFKSAPAPAALRSAIEARLKKG